MTTSEDVARRKNNRYAAILTVAFAVSYAAAMYIPLVYDYLNLREFSHAARAGGLIIQEHLPLTEATLRGRCESGPGCDFDTLFRLLEHEKMISSDYVLQMRRAGELSISDFILRSTGFLLLTLTLIFMVAKAADSRWRSILLVFLFMSSLALFPVVSGLPHTNGKFYYIFGTVFSVLIAASDRLTAYTVPGFDAGTGADLRNDVLGIIHQKWTRLLIFALTVAVVFVGTVAVTVWGYMNTVFGYNFSFYPFIGVLTSMALILTIFYLGVLRNILRIQEEIEEAMGAHRVSRRAVVAELVDAQR